MSASPMLAPTLPLRRRALWLLVAMHVPFFGFTIGQGGLGLFFPANTEHNWIAFPLAVMAGAIQLRHSLAAAKGVRPRYWGWTLLFLLLIAYLPIPTFGARWTTQQWFVVASLAMLLPGRIALPASIVSAIAFGLWYVAWYVANGSPPISGFGQKAWLLSYWEAVELLGGAGLYGATRLVHLMDELRDARAELAELAIGRERLRISRDLHDLLGQSLSAVSLKGDLAIRLLERGDLPRAMAEIEGLVSVARTTLHDLRDVAHREPPIALGSEIDRAADLLASTGTEARVDIAIDKLTPSIDELFAWALREGVTNVLRHSAATRCSISIHRRDDIVRLEVVNDGALPASSGGSGLSGLATRAASLSGTASARALADGRFRLRVDVPMALSAIVSVPNRHLEVHDEN